ncbi:MAG: hypothetical protein WAN75_02115, partial [Xanthobacteraceae bacterium]
EVAHKFYLVGFVRGFGIYAKSFFENGQKSSNLNKSSPKSSVKCECASIEATSTLRCCAMKA